MPDYFGIATAQARIQAAGTVGTINRIYTKAIADLDDFYDHPERQCATPGCLSVEVEADGYCLRCQEKRSHKRHYTRRNGV